MRAAFCRRPFAAVLTVLVLLVGTSEVSALADAERNTKPFTRFRMLLGGIMNDTMPFDVPFIVWGDIDGRMTDEIDRGFVVTWYAEVGSNVNCGDFSRADYRRISRVDAAKWTATDYTSRGETAPNDPEASSRRQFELLIPALKPRRNYCFLFQVGPGKPATFAQVARLTKEIMPAYVNFIRERGVVDELESVEVAERLRQDVIRAMLSAVPLAGVSPKPNSVFDPTTSPSASVINEFADRWVRVQNQHRRVVDGVRTLERVDSSSRNALDTDEWRTWLRSDAFRAVISTLAQASAAARKANTAPPVEEADLQRLQELTTLTRGHLMSLMTGRSSDDDGIVQLWEPDNTVPLGDVDSSTLCPAIAPLSQRCLNIDSTRAVLTMVQQAVARAIPVAAANQRAELATLAKSVEETIDDLDFRKVTILRIQQAVNLRHAEMLAHVAALEPRVVSDWNVLATTNGSFETRKKWYVSADTGFAFAPSLNEIFPYVGSNIYFRPVNTEAPPGSIGTRMSALIAFSWTNNILKAGERTALYGESATLFLGTGVRLSDVLKVSGGAVLFKGLSPNPAVLRTRVETTWFLSLSGDFDVAKIMGGLFGDKSAPPKSIGAGSSQ